MSERQRANNQDVLMTLPPTVAFFCEVVAS